MYRRGRSSQITTRAAAAVMASTLLVAACGGSGGVESADVSTTTVTTVAGPTTTLAPSFVILCPNGFSVELPEGSMTEDEAKEIFCTVSAPTTTPWEPDEELLVRTAQQTWPQVFLAVSPEAIVAAGDELCVMATDAPDATAFGSEASAIYDAGFSALGAEVFGPDDWSMFSIASLSSLCRPEMFRLYR